MTHDPRPQDENDPRFVGLDEPVDDRRDLRDFRDPIWSQGPVESAVDGRLDAVPYAVPNLPPRRPRAYRKPSDVMWAVMLVAFAVLLMVAAYLNVAEPTGNTILAIVFVALAVGVGFMVRALLQPLTDAQREIERLKFEAPRNRARRRHDTRFKKDMAITDVDDI